MKSPYHGGVACPCPWASAAERGSTAWTAHTAHHVACRGASGRHRESGKRDRLTRVRGERRTEARSHEGEVKRPQLFHEVLLHGASPTSSPDGAHDFHNRSVAGEPSRAPVVETGVVPEPSELLCDTMTLLFWRELRRGSGSSSLAVPAGSLRNMWKGEKTVDHRSPRTTSAVRPRTQ